MRTELRESSEMSAEESFQSWAAMEYSSINGS